MREYDRLTMLLAKCLRWDGLSQKEAEKIVRNHAETEAKKQRTLPVVVLRREWERLKTAKAHKNINEYIANGDLPQMDFEEFEATKSFFKRMYQNVRKYIRDSHRKEQK